MRKSQHDRKFEMQFYYIEVSVGTRLDLHGISLGLDNDRCECDVPFEFLSGLRNWNVNTFVRKKSASEASSELDKEHQKYEHVAKG